MFVNFTLVKYCILVKNHYAIFYEHKKKHFMNII